MNFGFGCDRCCRPKVYLLGDSASGNYRAEMPLAGTEPQTIDAQSPWVKIGHGCGILDDGSLWTWDLPGGPSVPTPSQIGVGQKWKDVSRGYGHLLAIRSDGTLWTMGSNEQWQGGHEVKSPVGLDRPAPRAVLSRPVLFASVLHGGKYSEKPTATITQMDRTASPWAPAGSGSGAQAEVEMNYTVTDVTVTDGGSDYTAKPTVSLDSEGGAVLDPVMSFRVVSISVADQGSGYTTKPSVGMGGNATAVVSKMGSIIESVSVTKAGSGYTSAPAVTVNGTAMPSLAAVLIDGAVARVSVAPNTKINSESATVGFVGGGGDGAAATATVRLNHVLEVQVQSKGSGYEEPPLVSFSGPGTGAAATAAIGEGFVQSVTVSTAEGAAAANGYRSRPNVVFEGGGGKNAAATVDVAGVVESITVTASGSGYTKSRFSLGGDDSTLSRAPFVTFARTAGDQFANGQPATGWFPSRGINQAMGVCSLEPGPVDSLQAPAVTAHALQTPPYSQQTFGRIAAGTVISPGTSFFGVPTLMVGSKSQAAPLSDSAGRVREVVVVSGGSGYDSPPTIFGVNATCTISGSLHSVSLTNTGSGYTSPPSVAFSAGNAAAYSVLNEAGGVSGIVITNKGSGYNSAPSVSLSGGGGSGATATCSIRGSVSKVDVGTNTSVYYSPPSVTFSAPAAGGVPATAICLLDVHTGVRFEMTSGGSGYSTPPTVTVTGGDGTGASATAIVNGSVTSVTLISGGSAYTSPPVVQFFGFGGGSGAAAVATIDGNGTVTGITITSGGSGYRQPPTVSIANGASVHARASAACQISGPVSFISTSSGSGYSIPPSVSFTGGGGTGAAATASLAKYFSRLAANSDGWTCDPWVVDDRLPTMTKVTHGRTAIDGAPSGVPVYDLRFDSPTGTDAAGTAETPSGWPTVCTLTSQGYGYTEEPHVSLTYADRLRQIGTDTWKAIAAGDKISLAIKSDGKVYWWGQVLGLVRRPTPVGKRPFVSAVSASGGDMGTGAIWIAPPDGDGVEARVAPVQTRQAGEPLVLLNGTVPKMEGGVGYTQSPATLTLVAGVTLSTVLFGPDSCDKVVAIGGAAYALDSQGTMWRLNAGSALFGDSPPDPWLLPSPHFSQRTFYLTSGGTGYSHGAKLVFSSYDTPTSSFVQQEVLADVWCGSIVGPAVYNTRTNAISVSGTGSGAVYAQLSDRQEHAGTGIAKFDFGEPVAELSRDGVVRATSGSIYYGFDSLDYGYVRLVGSNNSLTRVFGIRAPILGIPFPQSQQYTQLRIGGSSGVRETGQTLWRLGVRQSGPPVVKGDIELKIASGGSGYTEPAIFEFSQQPAGVATASVSLNGKVVSVCVTKQGSGYATAPAATISGGATCEAVVAGPVESVQITSGGIGYRQPPRVKFSQPGISATATAAIQDGKVVSVSLSEGGRYRTAPAVTFEPVPDVESISVTSGGSGYTRPPTVLLAGGSGSGASAVCSINGALTQLTLTSKGSGYSSPPQVVFSGGGGSGAAAIAGLDEATGEVSGVTILSSGSGYQSPPQVSFTGGGGGSGASAATKIAGPVRDVTVKSRGVNYDRPPQVFFQGGGGTGASATATTASPGGGAQATCRINGSVICCKITNEGSGYESQPTVTFSDGGNYKIADLQYQLSRSEITQQDFDDLAAQYRAKAQARVEGDATATVASGGEKYAYKFDNTFGALANTLFNTYPGQEWNSGRMYWRDGDMVQSRYWVHHAGDPGRASPFADVISWTAGSPTLNASYYDGVHVATTSQNSLPGGSITSLSRPGDLNPLPDYQNKFKKCRQKPRVSFWNTHVIRSATSLVPAGVAVRSSAQNAPQSYLTWHLSVTRLAAAISSGEPVLGYSAAGIGAARFVRGGTVTGASLDGIASVVFDGYEEYESVWPEYQYRFSSVPTVSIECDVGSGAAVSVSVDENGRGSVSVDAGGTGYGSLARAVIRGGRPLITPAQATATIQDGMVAGISLQAEGIGYTKAPLVVLHGGGGSGATAVAELSADEAVRQRVVSVTLTSPGSGYTSPPAVSFVETDDDYSHYVNPYDGIGNEEGGNSRPVQIENAIVEYYEMFPDERNRRVILSSLPFHEDGEPFFDEGYVVDATLDASWYNYDGHPALLRRLPDGATATVRGNCESPASLAVIRPKWSNEMHGEGEVVHAVRDTTQ